MIMHTHELLMTPEDLRDILSSHKNTFVKHGERKVTKIYPGIFKMEMPGFLSIGVLDDAIWFLLNL